MEYDLEHYKEYRCNIEQQILSPYAQLSEKTKGRAKDEPQDTFRLPFQLDRDRVIHCKAFRRLKHKTQVFLLVEGDHYRTRLTHTLEVAQIARSIARPLSLNEDLTEAIALAHDLGHSAFGHTGERELQRLTDGYFTHNMEGRRVVELLEKDGKGLNLTFEVIDGIENHRLSLSPNTLEGKIVAYADRIAYINHDIDDAIRAGIITEADLPYEARQLGDCPSKRIGAFIEDVVRYSFGKPKISMSPAVESVMRTLYSFMFENVYRTEQALKHEESAKAIIQYFFDRYSSMPDAMPELFTSLLEKGEQLSAVVCDCIASMTDIYAVNLYNELAQK